VYDPGEGIQVEIPYINSKKLYKDILRLNFFSNEKFEVEQVIGGGRDWSVEYLDISKEFSIISAKLTGNYRIDIGIITLNLPRILKLILAQR
jgi:hypothetical protein